MGDNRDLIKWLEVKQVELDERAEDSLDWYFYQRAIDVITEVDQKRRSDIEEIKEMFACALTPAPYLVDPITSTKVVSDGD